MLSLLKEPLLKNTSNLIKGSKDSDYSLVSNGSFHVKQSRAIYLTMGKIHEISYAERSHHSDFKTFNIL